MLNWGILGACISTFFGGMSSMLQKKESMHYTDRYLALVYQYMFIIAWGTIFILIYCQQTGASLIPSMPRWAWVMVICTGVIGYVGVTCMFQAYKGLKGGVALIIANMSVFIMYFANIALFPGSEGLTAIKTFVAALFFLIIIQFIIHRSNDKHNDTIQHHHFINKSALFAIGAAICGAIFGTGNNFLIKTGTINPLHTLYLTELFVFITAIIWYFTVDKGNIKAFKAGLPKRDGMIFGLIGLCSMTSGALAYFAYQDNPANLINFIRLFSIVTASTFCWLFLKDKLSWRQITWLVLAVGVLIAFLLV